MDSDDDVAYFCCRKCKGLFTSKDELKEHKSNCTGDSSGSPCAMVAIKMDSSPVRKSQRHTVTVATTAVNAASGTTVTQTTTLVGSRKRKLPIDGDLAPPSVRSKLNVKSVNARTARGKTQTVTTPSMSQGSASEEMKDVPSAPMGPPSPTPDLPAGTEGASPSRRYGLRTKAYDNLKAKLNSLSGRGTVLPTGADVSNKSSSGSLPEASPARGRKLQNANPKLIAKQGLELDDVFREAIGSAPEDECVTETLTPSDEVVPAAAEAIAVKVEVVEPDIEQTVGHITENIAEIKSEEVAGSLMEELRSLHENIEKKSSIDKLIQDVKQSLQTQQAVLSITGDLEEKDCPEVGHNETVATTAETFEGDFVCEPIEVTLQHVGQEETVTTVVEEGPVNTFNIGTGPDGEQVTVHLLEYKGEDDAVTVSGIVSDAGDSSSNVSPRKKGNEKLEALKKNAEGRESFSDFLQKVITAHAENERRNQMKQPTGAVTAKIVASPAQEPLSTIEISAPKSQAEETEVVEPTRIRRKQKTKKQRTPVHDPPNTDDYESITTIALGEVIVRKYRCKICNHETKFLGMMARHLNSHNSESGEAKEFKCDQCDFTCLFRRKLNSHMKCHIKPYMCEFCCYRTTQQNDLQRHMWRHTGEMPFKCDQCDYACRQKSLLISHQRKHTGELLSCGIQGCDYKTPYTNSLNTHKARMHATSRRYSCATCGYQTNERSCFDKHIKVHLGLKENKCPLCNYRAITVTDIKRHMRTHVPDRKKFSCDQCSYQTAYETSLRVHLMKHAGIRPFQCAECGYSSNMKSKVRRHMKVRHNTEDPSLILCENVKFSMRSSDYVKKDHEQADLPPIMKISYGTREAANITMDDDNNIQDTQIVQQFVIEGVAPDTVVATHQCPDCRFSCKTASALSLHRISYHSNSIVQIVNEEIGVKGVESHNVVQLGSAQCVSGGPLPEIAHVQEIECVSKDDPAISSLVAAAEDATADDQNVSLGDAIPVTEVVSVGNDTNSADDNQAVRLLQIAPKPASEKRMIRFVTVDDPNSSDIKQTIHLVFDEEPTDVESHGIECETVEFVAIEQLEPESATVSDYVPVEGDNVTTQIVTSLDEIPMTDVQSVESVDGAPGEIIHIMVPEVASTEVTEDT